jgi:hypothetical protein
MSESTESDPAEKGEGTMFFNDVRSTVRRWMEEGDDLTAFEIIGALEVAKLEVFESLKKHWERRKTDET